MPGSTGQDPIPPEEQQLGCRRRDLAAALIRAQFAGNVRTSTHTRRLREKGVHKHSGRQELRELMDYIYGPECTPLEAIDPP